MKPLAFCFLSVQQSEKDARGLVLEKKKKDE